LPRQDEANEILEKVKAVEAQYFQPEKMGRVFLGIPIFGNTHMNHGCGY